MNETTKIIYPHRLGDLAVLHDLVVVEIKPDGLKVVWQGEDLEALIYKEQRPGRVVFIEEPSYYKKDASRRYVVYTKDKDLTVKDLPDCLIDCLAKRGAALITLEHGLPKEEGGKQ